MPFFMLLKGDSNSIYDVDLDVQDEQSFSTIGSNNSKDIASSSSISNTITKTRKAAHRWPIMIVDDEPDIISVIRQSLKHDGFKVCSFTNAYLALEHFNSDSRHQNHHAVVISDIRMPGMNGYELAKGVKSTNSEVKVILMSAFEIEYDDNNDNNIKELLGIAPDVKIDAFIQKPFSILSLIDTINSIETL